MQALDALKLCLASIRDDAGREFELLVVEKGSCETVVNYLQGELIAGQIDQLILNRWNVGTGNGLLQVLRSSRGSYVFFSNGDIYYRPGWMEKHFQIMESFPNVGVVGGVAVEGSRGRNTSSTMRWAKETEEVYSQLGNLIPREVVDEFSQSVGLASSYQTSFCRSGTSRLSWALVGLVEEATRKKH